MVVDLTQFYQSVFEEGFEALEGMEADLLRLQPGRPDRETRRTGWLAPTTPAQSARRETSSSRDGKQAGRSVRGCEGEHHPNMFARHLGRVSAPAGARFVYSRLLRHHRKEPAPWRSTPRKRPSRS